MCEGSGEGYRQADGPNRQMGETVTRIFFTFTAMPEIDVSAAPGTPEPPRQTTGSKAGGGGSILTKGKWLKITRKGLLVTAMSRIGKEKERGTEMPDGLREEGR